MGRAGGGARQLGAQRPERHAGRRGVAGVIDGVVDEAAEGVDDGGVVEAASRQQATGQSKRAGVLGQHGPGARDDGGALGVGRRHAQGTAAGMGRRRWGATSGTTRSSTLAVDSTPGMPAPGWVLAPTK
jgi:hypothetical protein